MIKLAKPNISEEAMQKVSEVLRSGNLVQGKYVNEFECALSKYLNVKNAVVVSSGTAALHLALLATGIKEGDEVIVPAFTFPATANVVELVGAKPVFVDINLTDFCIDTTRIEKAITTKTKAIIPVHEFGQPAKMDDILKIAKKYELKIIEDAACALGAEFDKKKVGTFGDIGCFSFHPRKAITTGEGGVIVTNDDEFAEKLRVLHNHGISYKEGKVDFIAAGLNYRMTDFQAAIGLAQLAGLNEDIQYRCKMAEYYDNVLSDIEWITIPARFPDRKMVYQTYHILVDDNIDRNKLIKFLIGNGIEVNYGAHALNCLQFYKRKYNLNEDVFPKASMAYYNGIALPIGNYILKEDLHKIHKTIIDFIK